MYRVLSDIYYFGRMIKDKAVFMYFEYLGNEETHIIDHVDRIDVIETNDGFLNAFKNLFIEPTKIVDNIYLGNAYNASNFNQLDELNINTIINVTNEIPNYFDNIQEYDYLKININDTNSDSIKNFFDESNQYIKDIQQQKPDKNILIHCYMGSSRSATILTAYLLKNFNLNPKQAFSLLQEKRPVVNINTQFWDELQDYYTNL
jgi:protein-tyrosine phosphatase|tara:strand:- start:5534 stop:6145 length:612 start_codon:yes stop_codon:yes gene_type:complete